jgi:DNA-binding response OmpR family regulator
MMPGLSGPQLCEDIRADPHGANTYLILLTSHDASAQLEEGMRAGADDYLVKPLDPDQLALRLAAAATRASTQAPALLAGRSPAPAHAGFLQTRRDVGSSGQD